MASIMRFDKWQNSLGLGNAGITSDGHFYSPGSIVQVVELRGVSGDKTVTSGSWINLISGTFTTKINNSKIYMTYISGQTVFSSNLSNPQFQFLVDGTDQLAMNNMNHVFYGGAANMRQLIVIPILTYSTYSAGNHTITIQGSCYGSGNTITFDYQTTTDTERRGKVILMEVAQ